MRAALRHAALAALVSLLVACTGGGQTAGGGWDETENTMTARIQGPDGKPTAGAKVYLVDVDNWADSVSRGASPVVDSAITDSLGLVKLSTFVDGTVAVEAFHHGNASRAVREAVTSTTDTVPLLLRPAVSVEGTFDSDQRPSDVRIAGSSLAAPVHDDGSFSIPWVPTGDVAVMAVAPDADGPGQTIVLATTASVEPGAGTLQLTGLRSEVGHVLIEDFEDDIARNRFGPAISDNSGWWYASFGSGLRVGYPGGTLAGADCGEAGRCLRVLIERDSNGLALGMDIDLGGGVCKDTTKICPTSDSIRSNHDLAGFDSVTFRMKGDPSIGTIRFQLGTSSNAPKSVRNIHLEAPCSPGSAWSTVKLVPGDFSVPGVVSFDRTEILRHISTILWYIEGSGELMIDSVQIHGVSEQRLFRR